MKKLAIFEEVVRIMQEDSATKKDKAGADPATFRKRISEEMPDEDFFIS